MQAYLASQHWIDILDLTPGGSQVSDLCFAEDRDLSVKGFRNAILNSNHQQSDYALVLNMPLGSSPAFPRPQLLRPGHSDLLRTYLNHIVSEIRLLGSLVSRQRQLSCLHWPADMTSLLQPAEMTELLYHINRNFSVRRDQKTRFVFELPDVPEDEGVVALACGLGFTDVLFTELSRIYAHPRREMKSFIELLRHYGFRSVSARLDYRGFEKRNELEKLTRRAADLKLDALYVASHPAYSDTGQSRSSGEADLLNAVGRIREVLLARGYRQENLYRYAAPSASTLPAPQAVFGAGLGAMTIIDNLFAVNQDQLDQYYQLLDQSELPFGHGGYLQPERHSQSRKN